MVSIVVAVSVFAPALFWAVIGILGLVGALPRNRWLGIRSESTMRSAQAFRVGNRVAAPGTLGAAAILVGGGILTLTLDSSWSPAFGVIALVVAMVLVGAVSGYAIQAADAVIVPDTDDGCGCCAQPHSAGTTTSAGTEPDAATAASPSSDCGTDSCVSCTLRGICSTDDALHATNHRAQA
ncbi:MAG: SdpI family protein [Gordonia sp. (in: high G+C Gram-positive bacteria)]